MFAGSLICTRVHTHLTPVLGYFFEDIVFQLLVHNYQPLFLALFSSPEDGSV